MAVNRLGGADMLGLHTLPLPALEAEQVLIRLHTAGVGHWDIYMRESGSESGETRFPFVLGTDGAGTIAALGKGVKRLEVGERVYAYSYERAGFYAEYVAVPADKVAPVPAGLDPLPRDPASGDDVLRTWHTVEVVCYVDARAVG